MDERLRARRLPGLALGVLIAALSCTFAAAAPPEREPDPRLHWWREARFGIFIHWGLYSILGGEWQGQGGHAEWIRHTARIPRDEYEHLLERFDPQDFDAEQWAETIRASGARYLVITSKHHDGFCLFDSQLTDFDVASTPFRRDILRELTAACRRRGIRVGFYYSIMDWHHPDYLPRRGWESWSREGADFERYVAYLEGQVEELLSNFGEVDVFWFDGEWEGSWTHERGLRLYQHCRRLRPEVIINNRVDKGRGGMAGLTVDGRFAGDFGTPEQEIPATGLPGVDWETCLTTNDHWGWNRRDDHWKSERQLIRTLVDIASKGGNLLLNVGPTATGAFPAPAVSRLRAVGAWLARHGEAIYATQGSPFADLEWGRCTWRRDGEQSQLYLHVFDWPADGALQLPGLESAPLSAELQGTGTSYAVTRRPGSVAVTGLGPMPPADDCPVISLRIEGDPVVHETPRIEAPADILVQGLPVRITTRSGKLDIRYTVDGAVPSAESPICPAVVTITRTTTVRARCFIGARPVSPVVERTFRQVPPWPATVLAAARPGLDVEVVAGDWQQLPEFDALKPVGREVAERVALPPGPAREREARRFRGFIEVPADDLYPFALLSDDGARLSVDGRVVVDNDGLHGPRERRGVAPLARGAHALVVEYFNRTGGATLELRWTAIGGELRPVATEALRRH